MEKQIQSLEATIHRLQKEAAAFLTNYKLVLNGIVIQPTEIEVYYFKDGEFPDKSVHTNDLQQNNYSHFYIHRQGLKKEDSYKGGNRAGIDFVVSQEEKVYHSFLIRSAIINNDSVVGPNKVLNAIKEASKLPDFKDIENTIIDICPLNSPYDVVFSKRINLGATAEEYRNLPLRAVLCDDIWFLKNKYRFKEQMIVDYLTNKKISKDDALEFAREKLGYIPKKIREL